MHPERKPTLLDGYWRYLSDEKSASFIRTVSERYTVGTLERLALNGGRMTRRAAVLALCFLGDYRSNSIFGNALRDSDRGVRILADNGIRDIWMRAGTDSQNQELAVIVRLNNSREYEEAIIRADDFIESTPCFAEAWNQRGIAHFHLGNYEESANDCLQTLEINPYHFGAAAGMGHCYIEMDDAYAALDNFLLAVDLNPDLVAIRAQIDYLQRTLG